MLAERHGLSPDQVVLGNGAADLLHSAALALLSAGDELVMPWPSYPLYPLLAAHAGATPVPVEDGHLQLAVTERTRALVLCNPNDPTGTYVSSAELRRAAVALPDQVHVLLDEALVHFQDVEDVDACLRLVDDFPTCWSSGPSRRSTASRASARATSWPRTHGCWPRPHPCSASTR